MAREKKEKQTPWTEQKVLYKDGDPDVYRKFGWQTWRRMTFYEQAMWTEASDATPAPISKEVIEFNKQEANSNGTDAIIISAPATAKKPTEVPDGAVTITNEQAENTLKEDLKAELKERGIYFHPNSKLETLKKKLADADNPE